jgi:OOP family OmpA-OmpF porin
MKNYWFITLFVLVGTTSFCQVENDSTKTKINRWFLDFSFGSSRGIKPYNDGYYSTENDKFLGEMNLNSVSIGARYYVNKIVTFKTDLSFDRFTPASGRSLDFDVAQYRWSLQSMFNINRLFGLEETSKFKLMPHLGFNMASLKTIKSSQNQTIGSPDYYLGVIYGVTPSYNFSKKAAVFIDLTILNNFRQHHTWDGNISDEKNNLVGQMSSISLGISYKLGKPIDSQIEEMKKEEKAKNDALEKRVADIETVLKDVDKDGVPDYIDQENNSLEGAVVDSRGVMLDKNKNNIPDEIEKLLEKSKSENGTASKGNDAAYENTLLKAINDGYICVFFETGKSNYMSSSNGSINYIVNYLFNNPEVKMDIIGYTDEIGSDDSNQKLGLDRADFVKSTLINLGIESYRLKAISGGEEQAYTPSTAETRSLARKVIFRIKK